MARQPAPAVARVIGPEAVEIEGFHVADNETVALISGDARIDPDDADRMALSCYARAIDHVGVMSDDPVFRWVDRVILDLHFDACYFQKDKEAGQFRRRGIEITNPDGGPPAYVVLRLRRCPS